MNVKSGEMANDFNAIAKPGALVVFSDLPTALEKLVFELADRGTLEIYGDSLSAAWWRIGGKGVRLTGLQGYGASNWDLFRTVEFWHLLTEICKGADTSPASTPGATALRIVAGTSPYQITSPGERIQNFANASFSAGARHSKPGHYKEAFLYDLHSAFPFVMKKSLPFGAGYRSSRDVDFFVATVTFDYRSQLDFSPLWVRASDSKVYHPHTAKNVTLTLNSIDLATLERHGDLKIQHMENRMAFDCEPLLEPAQTYLAVWQSQYPQFRHQIKILRNSIYGKLAQQSTQKRYVLRRIKDIRDKEETKNLMLDYNGFEFGLFRHISTSKPFVHFPVASAITAHVRSMVYDALDKNSIAVRTDAILSKRKRSDLNFGKNDGQWDVKEHGEAIVFGDSGFKVANVPHMDGVQDLRDGIAQTQRRAKFAFGEQSQLVEWTPGIESKTTATARGMELTVQRGKQKEHLKLKIARGL